MAKFKVGDKVVERGFPDKVFLVTSTKGGGNFISINYSISDHNSRDFKLYKEPKMKQPKTEQPPKKTPHKHAKLIKAWADGAIIESKSKADGNWYVPITPIWLDDYEYRIRPEPKPDVVRHACVDAQGNVSHSSLVKFYSDNLKLTFDGETGKLKSAEVISS